MKYDIQIDRRALKFISKQDEEQKRRIFSAISRLPEQGDRKRLAGYNDLFRLRVGEYRIIYSVDGGKLTVYVIDAGNRGDIYKRYK